MDRNAAGDKRCAAPWLARRLRVWRFTCLAGSFDLGTCPEPCRPWWGRVSWMGVQLRSAGSCHREENRSRKQLRGFETAGTSSRGGGGAL